MFRFTIRDVLWLTVVVGLAVGWGSIASDVLRKMRNSPVSYPLPTQGLLKLKTCLNLRELFSAMARRFIPRLIALGNCEPNKQKANR